MPAVASYAPRGQPTRQGRNRPQRVQLFRNDNWPPRPPAQALPVPSFLGSPDSDTLLRALPTPSFVTPPEVEEVKPAPPVPTKAVIAASAVPLADWFADVVWALYLGPTVASGGGNSGLAGADKAPQPLAAFVHAVLSQTLASPQCAALGLYYLVRLPVRLGSAGAVRVAAPLWNVGVDSDGHTCYASVHDRERAARAAFVAELYGPGGEDVPYRLAALALMLGNKWLDDHTFTNKTWHEVTHLSLARLTALEQRALECFNYSLGVSNENWRAWLGVLKEEAQGALALDATSPSAGANPTPNPMSALAIDVMERLEKELEVLVGGVGAGVVDVFAKGVIGDRRSAPAPAPAAPAQSSVPFPVQSQSQSTVPFPSGPTEMELDELEMAQVEIDIDLDDGGPVPDELRRPVKVRLGAGGKVEDEAWVEKGWGVKSDEMWGVKSEDKWGAEKDKSWGVKEEKLQWGVKAEDKWGAKNEDKWGEKWDEMEGSGDEWERALRAAGGDQFVMGIVEDGEDRYARERVARDGAEWDRAVQRPGKDRAVQRPDKQSQVKNASAVGSELKAKQAHVPRVELYDARLRCDYPQYYAGYPKGYDGYRGYDGYPAKGFEGYPAKGYDGHPAKGYDGVGKGAYEYPSQGVYYPAYEAVPRDAMYEPGCVYDLGAEATAGFDYGCPYSYVPRQVPVSSWVPRSGGCVLS